MVGTVNVAGAVSGRATDVEPHSDLPKHAFGSCSICTRRLLSQGQSSSADRRPRSSATLPTRFLVQTTVVPGRMDGRG